MQQYSAMVVPRRGDGSTCTKESRYGGENHQHASLCADHNINNAVVIGKWLHRCHWHPMLKQVPKQIKLPQHSVLKLHCPPSPVQGGAPAHDTGQPEAGELYVRQGRCHRNIRQSPCLRSLHHVVYPKVMWMCQARGFRFATLLWATRGHDGSRS